MCSAARCNKRMRRSCWRNSRSKSWPDGLPDPTRIISHGHHQSVSQEADDILLASSMISLGARLRVLEAETSLSHDRLARLYREYAAARLPGHAAFLGGLVHDLAAEYPFLAVLQRLFLPERAHHQQGASARSSPPYLENSGVDSAESAPVLSFTRAWMLVRFFDGGMLQLSACRQCGGHFIAHAHDPQSDFVCAICRPPPRRKDARGRQGARRQPPVPASDAARSDRRRPNHQKPWKTPRNPPFWVGEQGSLTPVLDFVGRGLMC